MHTFVRLFFFPLAAFLPLTLLSPQSASAQCAQPGSGAALQQGECVFATAGFSRIDPDAPSPFAEDIDVLDARLGFQRRIDDNLFASLSGFTSHSDSSTNTFGVDLDRRSYGVAASLRKVHADYLFTAALTGFVAQDDFVRSDLTADQTRYGGSLSLSAARIFADEDGLFAIPSIGVSANYQHVEETAAGRPAFGVRASSDDELVFAVRPALTLGYDMAIGDAFFRPTIFGGATLLLNEDSSRRLSSDFVQLRSNVIRSERDAFRPFAGGGARVFLGEGFSAALSYSVDFDDNATTHSLVFGAQFDF